MAGYTLEHTGCERACAPPSTLLRRQRQMCIRDRRTRERRQASQPKQRGTGSRVRESGGRPGGRIGSRPTGTGISRRLPDRRRTWGEKRADICANAPGHVCGRACGQLCGQLCGRVCGQGEGCGAAQCRHDPLDLGTPAQSGRPARHRGSLWTLPVRFASRDANKVCLSIVLAEGRSEVQPPSWTSCQVGALAVDG